jgi:hypothetical protein
MEREKKIIRLCQGLGHETQSASKTGDKAHSALVAFLTEIT